MRRLAAKFAVIAAVAAIAGLWWLRQGDVVDVTIPSGLSATQTGALLEQHGVVRFKMLFRLAAGLSGVDKKLKPGTYRLRRNMPLSSVLRELKAGSAGVKVAVPEGFSAAQIAQRLEAARVCSAADFRQFAASRKLEGYLFPTTYYFEPGLGAEKAAQRMREEFKRKIEPEYLALQGRRTAFTLHQMVTLASIVEREAVLGDERPLIAAVYLNRLGKRMRLEADPTTQYALGYWKKRLNSADLRHSSPYNTYVHYGLPPGPICSPGLESFRSALNPAKTDALYFVADTTGGHIFSRTHDEHLKAKQSFKRARRAIEQRLNVR